MPFKLEIKRKFLMRSDRVKSVDLHPTEPWMLCSLYNGRLHAWNYETEKMEKTLEVCDVPVRAARFVARRNWILTGSDDMLIRVFNYNTMERLAKIEAHSDYIRCIAVHSTLPYFLSCSDDMSIKLWDWDANFQCKQTFEGHAHYVMQVVFNPKDQNTFVSVSLDRTIKMWSLGSSQANFTLDGHDKGINCVDFYHGNDRPYLVSGADDHLVKVWDYQNKTCVAKLEGHVQNVSAVCFHPDLPIIITGSEDNTIRIWSSSTYKQQTVLNYSLDRIWSIRAIRGVSAVAIGYDEGSVVVKLGREEPVISMDASGKLLWCRGVEIQQANLKTLPSDKEVANFEPLPLTVKDMGACDLYPQWIAHNSNGRFVVVCGEGEYIIYTAMALRNKSFGTALQLVWARDPTVYAIRETSTSVKVFQNFKDPALVNTVGTVDAIYGGQLLGVRSEGQLSFFDWTTRDLIRRIDVAPKNVYWSETAEHVAIADEKTFHILKYHCAEAMAALEEGSVNADDGIEVAFSTEFNGADEVVTATWINDCFVYTTANNRLHYVVGGNVVTVGHLEKPFYILGYLASESRLYLTDRDLNIVSQELSIAVLDYQAAVMRKDFDQADALLRLVPKEALSTVALFLEGQGYCEQALAVSQDPDHRFELAIKTNKLQLAFDIACKIASPDKWKSLITAAVLAADYRLPADCAKMSGHVGELLMIATTFGLPELLQSTVQLAKEKGDNPVLFAAHFLNRDLDACLEMLLQTGCVAEATLFCRIFMPSKVCPVLALWKQEAAKRNARMADSLADPEQYENLFPDYRRSLQLEAQRNATVPQRIAAADYGRLPPDFNVEDMIKLFSSTVGSDQPSAPATCSEESDDDEEVEEEEEEEDDEEPGSVPSAVDLLPVSDVQVRGACPTTTAAAAAALPPQRAPPDVASSSHCPPDLVPVVETPDVLMDAPMFRDRVDQPASGATVASQEALLDDDYNLDVDNLDVDNVQLIEDEDDDEQAGFDEF